MKNIIKPCGALIAITMIVGCRSFEVKTLSTEVGEFVELPGRNVYMAKTEVTQAQWMRFMDYNPASNQGDDLPVENVTLVECRKFVERLNQRTGRRFRLPTDDEWTFACLSGCGDEEMEGLEDCCWNLENSGNSIHAVATKKPNAWGIHDMLGNVWEWTVDEKYTDLQGGNRGGCYYNRPEECTVDAKYVNHSAVHGGFLGFRLVLLAP